MESHKYECMRPNGRPSPCFRLTLAGTASGRFLRGEVAMSSLRPLHADRLQIDCPRALLTMPTTRYFIKQSVTIRFIPCLHARSRSCVCCNHLDSLNRPCATSRRLLSVILKPVRPSQPRSGVHRSFLQAGTVPKDV